MVFLTLKPDMQIGHGPGCSGLGTDPNAYVFQHEVRNWPIEGQTIILRDMRTTGDEGRWRISRDVCRTWEGDFETAGEALRHLEVETMTA
jgi:hypothetical protein